MASPELTPRLLRAIVAGMQLAGALLILLLSATAAHAECAWVLWGQTVDPWNAVVSLSLGAWRSREECEQERQKREQAPEELRMASYACLPDTIDPRAPKGQ